MIFSKKTHQDPGHIVRSLKDNNAVPLLDWIREKEGTFCRVIHAYQDNEKAVSSTLQKTILQAKAQIEEVKDPSQFENWFIRLLVHKLETEYSGKPSENLPAVRKRLGVLDPDTRKALVLSLYGGMSANKIAGIMSSTEEKMTHSMHRGLKYIKACY